MKIGALPHPQLDARAFVTRASAELFAQAAPAWLTALLAIDAQTPLSRDEAVRVAVRELLRHGGYKPTGRGKPASEYLVRAAQEGALRSINAAVDCCNVVSLHSGLPISVIDLALAKPPLRIGLGAADEEYVFNPAGQVIRVVGLLCVFDAEGPCANPVKDAQRTKTSAQTRETLTVVWGVASERARVDAALAFYLELLARCGAQTELVTLE